ncbi:regulator of G-protein signaling 10 isoform X1 [Lepisosteus oculatus]|uniref:Regulator of G protein signaling 10 n=1 Tax=Lepisosteus oculatus TaxID=7918 RepID=W5N042_LEPOC|nr:PREDICTED: regulator of G-protein signaling 10 isoform X1 [Lepisosteus oculatus]
MRQRKLLLPGREKGRGFQKATSEFEKVAGETQRCPCCQRRMFNRAVNRLSRKRPPSEIQDINVFASTSQQCVTGAVKWSISLENLLEDPEGVRKFREFLKKEFSEENVLFWLACEEFKKIQDMQKLRDKAKYIYATYLSSTSTTQVNVEGQSKLNESMLDQAHPLMFEKLQEQIFNLMKFDSYKRFLRSDIFLKENGQKVSGGSEETVAKRASIVYNT